MFGKSIPVISLGFLFLAGASCVSRSFGSPPGEWGTVGLKVFFLNLEQMNRDEAQIFCSGHNMMLGTIETEEEAVFVSTRIERGAPSNQRLWLSARQDHESKRVTFYWEGTNREVEEGLFHEVKKIGIPLRRPFSAFGALNGHHGQKPNLLLTSDSTILDGVLCQKIKSPETITTTTTTTPKPEPRCHLPTSSPKSNMKYLGFVEETCKRYFLDDKSLRRGKETSGFCRGQGLQLASVESPREARFLGTVLTQHKVDECYWTAFEKRVSPERKETWIWSSTKAVPSKYHGFSSWIYSGHNPSIVYHGCVSGQGGDKLRLDSRESYQSERKGVLCQDQGKFE